MTPDQWFTFAMASLGTFAVLAGFLVGAYISRKARAVLRAFDPEQDDPEKVWLTVGFAIALLLVSVLLVILWAVYRAKLDELQVACNGVIANLDLTEWVSLCRK